MAQYPDEVATFRTKANRSGVEYDEDKETIPFAEDFQFVEDEIVAIETELGLLPAGEHDSVGDRITAGEYRTINFLIDAGGDVLETGYKGCVRVDFDCEMLETLLLADVSATATVDIAKQGLGSYNPASRSSICAGTPPQDYGGYYGQNQTLSGWTKQINAGDILLFDLTAVTNATKLTLAIKVKVTPA